MKYEYGHTTVIGTEEEEVLYGKCGEEEFKKKTLEIETANKENAKPTEKGKDFSKTSFFWIRLKKK